MSYLQCGSFPFLFMPSKETLREYLQYDHKMGALVWIKKRYRNTKIGSYAGCRDPYGRRVLIGFGGTLYAAHRLIWVWHFGEIPKGMVIDHINHDYYDNRIQNLRLVTHQQNHMNRSRAPDNKTGEPNIVWLKREGKYRVVFKLKGKLRQSRTFATLEEAIPVRDAMHTELGFHPNHGRSGTMLAA